MPTAAIVYHLHSLYNFPYCTAKMLEFLWIDHMSAHILCSNGAIHDHYLLGAQIMHIQRYFVRYSQPSPYHMWTYSNMDCTIWPSL